jgi:hypothetical protein
MTVLHKRNVRPECEAKAMTDITYDSEADPVYITIGRGTFDRTEQTGPSFMMLMPPDAFSVSKSCPPALCWRPEVGKKRGHRVKRTSNPQNSGLDNRDHPDTAIDEWIEAVYDWSVWK